MIDEPNFDLLGIDFFVHLFEACTNRIILETIGDCLQATLTGFQGICIWGQGVKQNNCLGNNSVIGWGRGNNVSVLKHLVMNCACVMWLCQVISLTERL